MPLSRKHWINSVSSYSLYYIPHSYLIVKLKTITLSLIVGVIIYYVVICTYLYGDLAIYAVSAPVSVAKVVW